MGKANKKKVIKRREEKEKQKELDKLKMDWQEIHDRKKELVDEIISMQMQLVELEKLVTKEDTIKKINGLGLTMQDLAREIVSLTDKYNLDSKSGPVKKLQDDPSDTDDYIHLLYGFVNISEKLIMLNGTSMLDIVIELTSDETLKESSNALKNFIKKEFTNEQKEQ